MSAYPANFGQWPEDKRNAYFAEKAAEYRASISPQPIPEKDIAIDIRAERERRRAFQVRSGRRNPDGSYRAYEEPLQKPKFTLEPFDAIRFTASEEWLIKRFLPRQGVAVLFGDSQAFKSFLAVSIAFHVPLGWEWAGRKVEAAPAVYIAAEGARGIRKRKAGFEIAHDASLPTQTPFFLVSAAPNLGAEKSDLGELIAAIEVAAINPGLIVIDTLAQSIGSADENGAGMIQFVANATELANRFRACVFIVHHIGLADDKRLRGHSSLKCGIDAQILCERRVGELSTVITLQKLKDEECSIRLRAHLSRIVIGQDEDGDDISTLVIDRIEDDIGAEPGKSSKIVPRSGRLIMDMVAQAIDEAGRNHRPFADGPEVRAVSDEVVRQRYYARIAEKASEGDDPGKVVERKRKSFNRAIKAALDAKDLVAQEHSGGRLLWLP